MIISILHVSSRVIWRKHSTLSCVIETECMYVPFYIYVFLIIVQWFLKQIFYIVCLDTNQEISNVSSLDLSNC